MMHLNGSTIFSVDLIGYKQAPCIFVNHAVKGNVNLITYGYANNSISTIGNDLVSDTGVAVISNSRVEVLLTERNSHWLALFMTSAINPS